MINKLKNIALKAYVPYSNFHVAAFFKTKNNSFYGFNIENASYPHSICAERVGLYSAMINELNINEIEEIHIFSPDSKGYLSPCGGCRQTLGEHINKNTKIFMYNREGKYVCKYFYELLPMIVEKDNINGVN